MRRLLICLLVTTPLAVVGAEPGGEAELVEVRKIWDEAPHNAFTDLIRFQDRWLCVFREGQGHVSPDGAVRVLASEDGGEWASAARISSETADLRDPKIALVPDGRLMLTAAAAPQSPGAAAYQTLAWFSDDGRSWGEPVEIGDPDFWLWRVTWHKDAAYGIGYGCQETNKLVRLYQSRDGKKFDALVETLFDEGYPNETSLVFLPDETCLCLLRRDEASATAQLGSAPPPYTQWTWKDLGVQIGGPHMLRLADGRLVAAVRLYDGHVRTALVWLDPTAGTLQEFLALPSGGDTSYAGLVEHDGLLWVSYYASHEGKTSIYLAKVRLSPP